jgi:hypothetical protein
VSDTEATQPTYEEWVYAGTRINGKGQKADAWVPDPDGQYKGTESELWYLAGKGKRSHNVGHRYRVRVERGDGGKVTLYGGAEWISPHTDQQLRAELEVRHRAADTRLRREAMEKSAKRSSALDEALEPLLAIAKRTPTFDRDALLVYVMRRLSRA